MANTDMKGFLTQYFMQRIFNAMSPEQFAQYQDIIKNKDFIGNMKNWKEKWNLVVESAPGSGQWIKNETMPDPATFGMIPGQSDTNEEWEKLYKELRNAFRAIATGRDNLDKEADKNTLAFLDAFYGFGQLFSPAELTGAAKDKLDNEFIPFLESNKTNLYQALKDLGIYTDTEKKFSDFVGDLGKGKHNTDDDVRDMLMRIISYLRSSYYASQISERMGGAEIPDLQVLADGLENDDVDASKVDLFKDNYRLILNPLEREKNIYQNFGPHLKTVKTAIETARKNVDYNNADSKDFLKEKRPDKKSPIEQTVDNVKDWWHDHTDKYVSLHKSRLFYSDEAKAIAKAIDGAKFKPTDGLDKFVENLKTIGGKVKGNIAQQHFKWFSDTLTKLHGDKQMSSIFAGALKNPRKLKELAAEFAMQGIKDGKKDEEIFTAMEVLKTIQYGYATSNHLNAVLKQDLSLFSDKSLSWNKNEGMSFVMKGLDNTINFAIKGTALIATTGYNIINRNIGNKFNGKQSKRTMAAFAAREAQLNAQRADKEAQKNLLDGLDRQAHANAETERNATGITDATLVANEQRLGVLRADADAKKTTRDNAQGVFNTAQKKFNIADAELTKLDKTITTQKKRGKKLQTINKRLQELQTKIEEFDAKGDTIENSERETLRIIVDQKARLEEQKKKLTAEIRGNTGEYRSALQDINQATTDHDNAKTAFETAKSAFNTAQAEYNTASSAADDLYTKITQFNTATQRMNDASARLDKRQEEFEKWENEDRARFGRLMAHWDFLNSGRMRTGENIFQQVMEGILPLSQKDRQKRYNGRRIRVHNAFLTKYQNEYGLAA